MTRKVLLSIIKNCENELQSTFIRLNFENHMKHLDHINHYNQVIKAKC